jgi:hypothetical protein
LYGRHRLAARHYPGVKDKGEWKIVAYHNVDVKAQTPVPDPS